LGRWVSAEAAAVLAAVLDRGLRSTFDAADAARLLVTSVLLANVRYLLVLTIRPDRHNSNYDVVGSSDENFHDLERLVPPTIS
jgi:hypothetical protein